MYLNELVQLAESLHLRNATAKNIVSALSVPEDIQILFLLSVPASLKATLLRTAKLLLYTPPNEHFGIVPLEAMLRGVPVLAANTGGPLETVVEGQTGWLRPVDDVGAWAEVISSVISGLITEAELERMSDDGRRRVKEVFSREKMAERLELEMDSIGRSARGDSILSSRLMVLGFGVVLLGGVIMWNLSRLLLGR